MEIDASAWLDRPGIKRLLECLDAQGGHARFVGGAVRDLALGIEPGDLDLATTHRPQDVITRLEAAHIKAVPTGLAHGTVTAVSHGTVVEVTTLRADLTTDGRRATVAFTDDWQADAARRDFTINALYADPFSGAVHDYFGGMDDLRDGRVRFIGDALTRIAEDHLRILRYFRFHARYGKGVADQDAIAACAARANDLMALSRERIADELLKLLALPDPSPTLALMQQHQIFAPVLPELLHDASLRVATLAARETVAHVAPDPVRRLAAMLPPDPAQAERIAARLKLSNKARKRLIAAATERTEMAPRVLAYRLGVEGAVDRLLLDGKSDDADSLGGWTLPRLPISGGDLIARGITQGPLVARTLRQVEERWIAEDFVEGPRFLALVEEVLAASA